LSSKRGRRKQWRRMCVINRHFIQKKSQLSKQGARLLLVMCTELVNLCAKLTGKIDPAAGAMLAYVRDDIVSESKVELQ
jgi:hypothetical protein